MSRKAQKESGLEAISASIVFREVRGSWHPMLRLVERICSVCLSVIQAKPSQHSTTRAAMAVCLKLCVSTEFEEHLHLHNQVELECIARLVSSLSRSANRGNARLAMLTRALFQSGCPLSLHRESKARKAEVCLPDPSMLCSCLAP